jgi:hypothetical protein
MTRVPVSQSMASGDLSSITLPRRAFRAGRHGDYPLATPRLRKFILAGLSAFSLLSSVAASFAQVPGPVPALPDAERRTSYSISSSICSCAVGMQLFGDSTDYANWIEVFVNGVLIPQSGNWTISSPTGPIATIPRPITDAVLTFTAAQTGTVQIVGARRPRRTTQFQESQPVPTRNFNQVFSDIIATQRELWDKTNDFTGRGVFAPPGETLKMLPALANRQNMGACFDSGGNLQPCVAASSGSFIAGNGISFTGANPTTITNNIAAGTGITLTGTNPITVATNFTPGTAASQNTGTSGANVPLLNGNNTWSGTNSFPAFAFGGKPWFDVTSAANSCAAAVLDGVTDDTTAIQCHVNYMHTTYNGGAVYFPPATNCALIATTGGVTIPSGVWLEGSGANNVGTSCIKTATDLKVLSFQISGTTCPSGNHYGGMEKISVFGYNNAAATQDTVWIGDNCNVTIKDSIIWYGANALKNRGVDSAIQNSFIWGYTSALTSNGANWYFRVKFDQPGGTGSTHAYLQGANIAGLTTAENTFVECDFSGTYTDSVLISDTNNSSVTKFIAGIFSSPFIQTNARYVQVSGSEFGSATMTVTAGTLVMSSSVGLTAITVTGAGSRVCAANASITC